MALSLYNYLHGKKECFVPIHNDHVGMYVCGPTVYSNPHLGHARSAVVFDTLYRYLKYLGYNVRYVRNITDVGHLEDENNETGEDKLEKRARIEKREPMEVANYYSYHYRDALQKLNVLPPSIEPIASGHIIEQQQLVQALLEKQWAYEKNGSIYFDLTSFASRHSDVYGMLSGRNIKDAHAGERVLQNQEDKKSSLDFALWKHADESHIMKWPSSWSSAGFPGWHTECSAMSKKYLGIPFDIHGGGLDLQFPHHEAEIAQSFALHGVVPANYWLYNNMITIENRKMSKSLGNFIDIESFFSGMHKHLKHAYAPYVIRFFILRSHYRSIVDVSDEVLSGVTKGMQQLIDALYASYDVIQPIYGDDDTLMIDAVKSLSIGEAHEKRLELEACMNNDMDTPAIIASLFSMAQAINTQKEQNAISISHEYMLVFYVFLYNILGLCTTAFQRQNTNTIAILVDSLLELRIHARTKKDYALSDTIRKILTDAGIIVKDLPDGSSTWNDRSYRYSLNHDDEE